MANRFPSQEEDSFGATIRLLKDYQAGDAGALNQLLKRIGPRILLSARSRRPANLRNKMDSMDILQEVMRDALPRLKDLEITSEGSIIHWFSTLITNQIADQAKYFHRDKRSISREIPLDGAFGGDSQDVAAALEPESPELTPSGEIMASERMRIMEDAIDKLPPEYQEVIRQRNIEGLDFNEIGKLMDKTSDAARKLYSRAITQLTMELNRADKE